MTIAAVELNDQALLIQSEDGSFHSEPGFARLTPDGIVTGEDARAIAWREPQHVHNQYWCHLSQTPLPGRHRFARHNADIAYAQLRRLWQLVGSPEALILLVPGSFTRDQLALLLGLVEALPARVDAIIDSALAACLHTETDTLHVDLQMHQLVLTVCRPQDGAIRVAAQEVFPGLGMGQIQNAVARYISDQLIEGFRIDPLHSSATEQEIFDKIPNWLTRLRWEPDISVRLASEHGDLPCNLRSDAIRTRIDERMPSVRSFLDKWPGCSLLLSHASLALAGLADEFADADIDGPAAGTERCLSHQAEILDQVDGLYRVRELGRIEEGGSATNLNGAPLATHVLCGDLALPLSKPVSIWVGEGGPRISSELDDTAALTIVERKGSLEMLRGAAEIALPQNCLPGATIGVGGHELRLIRVRKE